MLIDADPTGGRLFTELLLVGALAVVLFAWRRRLAVACAALSAGALLVGLLNLPVTAFPPHAFRFLCLPFWLTLLFALLAFVPRRFQVALVAAAATVGVVGLGARLLLRPLYTGGVFTQRHYYYHPVVGYSPRPAAHVRGRKSLRGQVSYDVEYVHDRYGRRELAVPDRPRAALLCFGCSVTYGEGVEANECWPAQVAAAHPDLAVYNYAFSGWGPAQLLDLVSTRDLAAETVGPRRHVYYFLDSHVARVTGSWPVIAAWAGSLSRYRLAGDRPQRVGAFSLTQSLPEFLACHSGFPAAPPPADLALVAALFGASRERLGNLLVIFEPGSRYADELIPRLQKAGVECLRLTGEIPRLPGDPHPSAEGQRLLAEQIARGVGDLGQDQGRK